MKTILIWIIKFYRLFISPILGARCRFHPTCSRYALQAVEKYGAIKGSYLTVRRVLKCHPFNDGGYDPLE